MANYPIKTKDPNAILDYTVDWTKWFGETGDIIQSVTWTVPSGITKTAQTSTTREAVIWLSGGTIGQNYDVSCVMTTRDGRRDQFTFRISVEKK